MGMEMMMMNASRIAKILEKVGPENAKIKVDGAWDLSVYYVYRSEKMIEIEMFASKREDRVSMVDPLMKIELALDENGAIKTAHPIYYQSHGMFFDVELYSEDNRDCWNPELHEKPGELDRKLNNWLDSIDVQGYLRNGMVEKIL
ncbi:MAG: hypothetical protein IKR39_00690 [Lachnospiraceae bacterium]|nr:hypothetical protein [Lachnospiraceae bacterium]